MARFLTTLPENLGFWNLGTVQSYPTGGTGPTAYGPTGIFGSDPLPANPGDNLYDPIDLGDFSSPLRAVTITNSHGGLSRKQSTFINYDSTSHALFSLRKIIVNLRTHQIPTAIRSLHFIKLRMAPSELSCQSMTAGTFTRQQVLITTRKIR